jgi:hypothetical protein
VKDGGVVNTGTGESVSFEEIGYESIYGENEREHLMGQGSFSTDISPTPYGAQFVDVTVDKETGEFEINELVQAVDVGTAIDPKMAEGQIEGSQMMALEYATEALLTFDDEGVPEVNGFRDYGMPRVTDMPEMETILVETHDPTGPFGAKSVGEVPVNPLPPALANAIHDAVGVRIRSLPITAEKIRERLHLHSFRLGPLGQLPQLLLNSDGLPGFPIDETEVGVDLPRLGVEPGDRGEDVVDQRLLMVDDVSDRIEPALRAPVARRARGVDVELLIAILTHWVVSDPVASKGLDVDPTLL